MIKIMEYMALGKPIVQFNLKEGRFQARVRLRFYSGQSTIWSPTLRTRFWWLLDHPDQRQIMGRCRVANE